VFIGDRFIEDSKYEAQFNGYWHARIGTLAEYRIAAEQAGFSPDRVEDLSARTEHFWSVTIALIEAEGRDSGASFGGAEKREKSLQAFRLMRRGSAREAFVTHFLVFPSQSDFLKASNCCVVGRPFFCPPASISP